MTESAAPEAAPPPARPPADEELKALDAALNKAKASSTDADSFWDAAVEEEAKPAPPGAMSFEEAQRLGLIPKK